MSAALFFKMFRDRWRSLLAWSLVIVFMVTIQLSVYPSIKESGDAAKDLLDSYPEAFKKMFRIEDYTTGSGFLSAELFSLMIPLVMLGVGLTWGCSATAEEEERGTADLLFSLPIRRRNILMSKMSATFCALLLLASITFFNVFLLEGHFELSVSTLHLFYACLAHLFLGVYFSGVGFLLGSLSGKRSLALGTGIGIGIVFFIFFTLAPLVTNFKFTNPINPFQWTIARNILKDGLDVWGLVKLISAGTVLYIAAIVFLERREVRS